MKIFVSTGEVSGDLHLSYLVKECKKLDSDVQFYGVAGKYSENVGVKIVQNIDELAIMGFTEGLKKYSYLKKKAYEYLDFIKKENIKKILLVDYGGFNLRFLQMLKREINDICVYYYIPPKLWVWGEKRINKLKLADYIMVIFPWEVEFYEKHCVKAIYFGNPFVERYKSLKDRGNKILLLPGSRKQEINSVINEYIKLIEQNKTKKFILKLSSKESLKYIDINLDRFDNLEIIYTLNLQEAVQQCEIAVAVSGTVTLELALLGIPTIVVYKTNIFNYFIAKYILKVGYVSLPNITINEQIFPELLQKRCNFWEIDREMNRLLDETKYITERLEEVRSKLSGIDITKNYAKFLLKGRFNGKN